MKHESLRLIRQPFRAKQMQKNILNCVQGEHKLERFHQFQLSRSKVKVIYAHFVPLIEPTKTRCRVKLYENMQFSYQKRYKNSCQRQHSRSNITKI